MDHFLFLFLFLLFVTLLPLRESITDGQRLDAQHDPQPLGFAERGLEFIHDYDGTRSTNGLHGN